MGLNLNIIEIYKLYETLSTQEKSMVVSYLSELLRLEKEKNDTKVAENASQLQEAWTQILSEIRALRNEPYIDDQIEITNIYEICEKIISNGELGKEPWELRKKIIKDVIRNHYYSDYSVDEPLEDLIHAMCTTKKEKLECADILINAGPAYIAIEGAKIYKEQGQPEKYYKLMENQLGSEPGLYLELISFYKDSNPDKAAEIAERGLKKCNRDRTELLIHLIQYAKNHGNEEEYYKLLRGARLRSHVDVSKIYETFMVDNDALRALTPASKRSKRKKK